MALHGPSGNLGMEARISYRNGTWTTIAGIQSALHNSNLVLDDLFLRNFDGGRNIRFWRDKWVGNCTLEERYPRIAALDMNVDCFIAERITRADDGICFRGNWRREVRNGREAGEISEIANLCRSLPSSNEGDG